MIAKNEWYRNVVEWLRKMNITEKQWNECEKMNFMVIFGGHFCVRAVKF